VRVQQRKEEEAGHPVLRSQVREAAKKSSFVSGRATKRGGGLGR